MKIAFISDIHGNAVALEAVLADVKSKNVNKIVVLGDICYRGPEPKRALELVRSLKTDVIKGNADAWITRGIKEGEVPATAFPMMTEEQSWSKKQLSSDDLQYLANLPETLQFSVGPFSLACFHASPTSLFDIISPTEEGKRLEEKIVSHLQANIYLYGHIHTPYIRFFDGKCIVNSGSVGLPFDGMAKASYALLEVKENDFQVSIQRVTYPTERVIEQYLELDYPNADMMSHIIKTGQIKR